VLITALAPGAAGAQETAVFSAKVQRRRSRGEALEEGEMLVDHNKAGGGQVCEGRPRAQRPSCNQRRSLWAAVDPGASELSVRGSQGLVFGEGHSY